MFRLLSASKQQGKIMDSFDSTEKANTTVHGITTTKSVDVNIYYTKWAQLQNALSFIPHGAASTADYLKKTWSFKPFSFKVIKYLHFLPLLLFLAAQNIPIPYWKAAAPC